jgi:YD repeat-containing protein
VTIVFPDNKVYKFQAQASPPCQSFLAITNPTITFQQVQAVAGTQGASLAPLDGGNAIIDGGAPGIVNVIGLDGNPYDPTQFRMTLASGYSYVIDQKLGVTSVSDPNGNTLNINASGITSSTGVNVVFQRDSQGRITSINDLNGKTMSYAYNGADLASFTDRQGNQTTYGYAAGDYLTSITLPNGANGLSNNYDSSGRLQSTADALNNAIAYNHDLTNHKETVTDRLGNATIYVYDQDGNITQTTDALGNVTSYSSHDKRRTYSASGDSRCCSSASSSATN